MNEIVDTFVRVWSDITSGVHAPLSFRLILQPLVAAFFAIRAGMQDARTGRPFFFWAVVNSDPIRRKVLLREGWEHVGRVFLVAVVVDVVYQLIVHHWVYPLEALMVAALLTMLPYFVMRGLVNRFLCRRRGGNDEHRTL